jgi:hypothetical protein
VCHVSYTSLVVFPPAQFRPRESVAVQEIPLIMEPESPNAELLRLLKEERKTREDEAFGRLSAAERNAYYTKKLRIAELEHSLTEEGVAAGRKAQQKAAWNDATETDLSHQSDARQPYRGREKDSERFAERNRKKGEARDPDNDRE